MLAGQAIGRLHAQKWHPVGKAKYRRRANVNWPPSARALSEARPGLSTGFLPIVFSAVVSEQSIAHVFVSEHSCRLRVVADELRLSGHLMAPHGPGYGLSHTTRRKK
jgi:hypothetical protein